MVDQVADGSRYYLDQGMSVGDTVAGGLGMVATAGALAHRFVPGLGKLAVFQRSAQLGLVAFGWTTFRAGCRLLLRQSEDSASDVGMVLQGALGAANLAVGTELRALIAAGAVLPPSLVLIQSAAVLLGIVIDSGLFLRTAYLKLHGERTDITYTQLVIQGAMTVAFGYDRQTFQAASGLIGSVKNLRVRSLTTPDGTTFPAVMMMAAAEERGPLGLPPSKVIEALGPERVVTRPVRHLPAKLVWLNRDLAERLGIELPEGELPPELVAKLQELVAWRVIQPGEAVSPEGEIFAASYSGMEGAYGDGRGGILPWGDLFAKGTGKTGLHNPNATSVHTSGTCDLRIAVAEVIGGEIVNSHLLQLPGGRAVTIVGLNERTEVEGGMVFPTAIVVRGGGCPVRHAMLISHRQYREHHTTTTLARSFPDKPEAGGELFAAGGLTAPGPQYEHEDPTITPGLFWRVFAEYGFLQTRPHPEGEGTVPDLTATLEGLTRRLGDMCAKLWRWRLIHGVPSASNMLLGGELIDLEHATAQPRTARYRVRPYTAPWGEAEASFRPVNMKMMYDTLFERLSPAEQELFNALLGGQPLGQDFFDFVFWDQFNTQLGRELLMAAGFKEAAAQTLHATDRGVVDAFRDVVMRLAKLENPGPIPDTFDAGALRIPGSEAAVQEKGVVDVFKLLAEYPEIYFGNPQGDHQARIRGLLGPIVHGTADEQAATNSALEGLVDEFQNIYHQLMESAARSEVTGLYDTPAAMQASLAARARFANRPMDQFFIWNIHDGITDRTRGEPDTVDLDQVATYIDETVEASRRNVEDLLRGGMRQTVGEDGLELGRRTVHGVRYAVHASRGGERRLVVRIPGEKFSGTDVGALTLNYQVGEGVTGQATPTMDSGRLTFEIDLAAGQLGFFQGDLAGTTLCYAFASPDRLELDQLLAATTAPK